MTTHTTRHNLMRGMRKERGAIDLASILVGVLVMGVLGAVIAASVFVVIPWSQDAAAKASLDGVKTAQSVSQVKDGKFQNWAGLTASKLMTGPATNVDAVVNAAGDCYISAAKSGSGTTFYKNSRDNTVLDDKAGPPDTNWCVNSTRALADPSVNLAVNPAFAPNGAQVTARTNLSPTGSFEASTAGWTPDTASPTLTASATVARSGSQSLKAVSTAVSTDNAFALTTGSLPAGTYTLSYYVYSIAARTAYFDWTSSPGPSYVGTPTVVVPANTWTRVSGRLTTSAAQTFTIYMHNTGGPNASGQIVYADDVLLERALSVNPYFDGASGAGYSWTGAPHVSTSVYSAPTSTGFVAEPGVALYSIGGAARAVNATTSLASVQLPNTVVPDTVYTVLIRARSYNGGVIKIIGLDTQPTIPLTTSYEWYRYTDTSNTVTALYLETLGGEGAGWDATNVMVVAGAYTGPYFDGASANGSWNGAANASTSTGWIRR